MDASMVRNIGITIGAAALAGSLAVATFAGDPQAPAPTQAPLVAGPLPAAPPAAEAPAFEAAGVDAPLTGAPLSFLVRFEGSGAFGRAQALAEQGREIEARRAAEAALGRHSALRGLCFDRFTVGGAEMVLRVCEPAPAEEQAQTSALWLARLRDMSAVAYAEMNSVASPAQTQ